MRKLIKKIIGSLLCVIMIMAFLPLSAMAENNEVVIDNNGMSITVPSGGSITLIPKGADADPTGTTYEWMRFTDRGFGDYYRDMDWSANTARLELTNITEDCRFQCNITPTTGVPRYATVRIVIPKEENHLQIKASDTPVGETDGKVMVPAGETAHISVQVTADNLEGLTYKWGRKPIDRTYSPIIPYVTIIPDENSNSLDIKNVQIFENYYCEVTDKFGNKAQATFYVGVDNNLCFTDLQNEPFLTELKGQVGEELTVCANVSATEMDGMSYKWTVQDNSTYMLQEFTTEDLVFTVSKPSTISLTVIDKYNNMIMRYYNLKIDDGLKPNVQVSITETDIEADGVFNTDGYGSLTINSTYNLQTGDFMSSPKAALVDYTGKFIFPYKDTWLRYRYFDGVVSLTADSSYEYFIHYPNNNNYDMPGFYYLDGTEVFQNNYRCVSPMIDGYAIVNSETDQPIYGNYCLINKQGNIEYTFEDSFNNFRGFGFGPANAGFSAESMLRWPSEDLIAYSTYGDLDSYTYMYPGLSIGWKNLKGETIFTSNEYNYCLNFHEDLIGIANIETGKWGYLNKEGEEVIPCQFDSVGNFSDGFAYAALNGKYGYIDKSGNTVIPFEYDDAYGAGSGLFSVVKDGKCGLVDSNNTIVVPLEYDDISSAENNAAYAIKDGKLTIINVIESDNDDEKHELIKITAKSPTMTTAGNIECYFCKDCNKHFRDANGLEELDESEWAIPASGANAIDVIANDESLNARDIKSALSETFGESELNESLKELLTSENTETSEKTKEALAKLEDKFAIEKVIENPLDQDSVKVDGAIGMALNNACTLTVGNINKETFELIKEQQDLKNIDIENGVPFSMELKNSNDEAITELDIPMVIKLKIPEDVSTDDLRVIQIHGDETIIHVPKITMEEETLYATIVVTGFSDFMLANALPVQYVKGDVNNDGEIDANDITALARHAAKISTIKDVNILSNCCDVDGDGSVGASDVTKLARYVAKLITEL